MPSADSVRDSLSSIPPVRLRLGVALLTTMSIGALASPAGATLYEVARTDDGTGSCSGPVCSTLRAAISTANAHAGADEIALQPGTFRIELGAEKPDNSNEAGDLDVTGDLTIAGAGPGLTKILGALPAGEGEGDIDVPGNANLTLTGMAIAGGRSGENAFSGVGGGVASEGTGTLTLEHVVVERNSANGKASFGDGGGVYKSEGRLVIRDAALIKNTTCCAGFGGGVYIGGLAATADLTNVTIAENVASWRGGGLESDAAGPIDLSFVTIYGNESENQGGGIGHAEGVHIRDTIIDKNFAPTLPENTPPSSPNCLQAPVSEGGNVADAACGLSQLSDAPVLDPLLALLGGSPMPVLEPLAGSPALDRAVGPCPGEDARGYPRPQGSGCDSGAAERGSPVTAIGGGPNFGPSTSSGGGAPPAPPPGPTSAQIRAGLLAALAPKGKRARIAALLKRAFSLSFHALVPGTLSIGWYFVPPGAHLARSGRKAKPKQVLIAAGSARFAKPGTYTFKIKLTARGKQLLGHATHLGVTAKGVFKPAGAGAGAVSARKAFVLKR
jgi:hypothetical protein